MKKIISLLTAVFTLVSVFAFTVSADDAGVEIDGVDIEFEDTSPYFSDGTLMVPLRFTTEAMGLSFNWYPARQQAEIVGDDYKAVFEIGSKTVSVTSGGEESSYTVKKAPYLENNRMLCSRDALKPLADETGYNIMEDTVDGKLIMTSVGAAKAVVGGKLVSYSGCAPAIVNGGTMFPVRFVVEAMRLTFSWYPSQGKAVVSDGRLSVDLPVDENTVKFGSTTFIADRNIILNGNRMYASAPTLKRLAEYFGATAGLEGRVLTITPKDAFTVTVNGKKVSFDENGLKEIDGTTYIPLREIVDAMNLSYNWSDENKLALISDPDAGIQVAIGLEENYIDINGIIMDTDAPARLVGENVYVTSETLIATAQAFDGDGALNRYGNGLVLNVNNSYTVSVNDAIVVFPDVQPQKTADGAMIPLRFAAQEMGMEYYWDSTQKRARVVDGSGKEVTLDLIENTVSYGTNTKTDEKFYLEGNRLMASDKIVKETAEFFGLTAKASEDAIKIYDPSYDAPEDYTDEEAITVELDGKTVEFPDAKPCIVGGRTLIPVRAVTESMGMEVSWDGESRTVTIEDGDDSLKLKIDSAELNGTKDGNEKSALLDVPAAIIDERTCVPIRAVMEFFGASVSWDADTRTVIISSAKDKTSTTETPVSGADDFASMGFRIDAPDGAADVSYAIDFDTAIVRYSVGGIEYVFKCSSSDDGGSVADDFEYSGSRLKYKTDVNGVTVNILSGDAKGGGSAAQWEIGAYHFSLYSSDEASDVGFFSSATDAASTFVLKVEVEPAAEQQAAEITE